MVLLSILRKGLLTVLFLVLILAISGFSFLGVPLPQPLVTQQYGPYQLAAFETGLALYQTGSQTHYYSFSPLNDFYLDAAGQRSSLLPVQAYQAKDFQTNLKSNSYHQHLAAVRAYFGLEPLVYDLTAQWEVTYQAEPQNSGFRLLQQSIPPVEPQVVSLGSTFKLSYQDLVFSPDHQLYSQSDPATIAFFNQLYGTNLQPTITPDASHSAGRSKIPGGQVIIHNPTMPGFITITAEPGQTMWLDTTTHLLEIVTQVSKNLPIYHTKMNVLVTNSYPTQ